MNAEIGTKAAQFTGKEYINGIFLAVHEKFSTIPILNLHLQPINNKLIPNYPKHPAPI
jgi:hypothetical protein